MMDFSIGEMRSLLEAQRARVEWIEAERNGDAMREASEELEDAKNALFKLESFRRAFRLVFDSEDDE